MNESTASMGMMILWMVVIFGVMYFLMIRPQKKEQKRTQELMDSMEIGDYVLTTSGFYGVLIDISDDDVIVRVQFIDLFNVKIKFSAYEKKRV